jgi:hypothetical protein
MGGLPTLLVELDDGSGTFPHDVTDYVDLSAGWSIPRGRDTEGDSIDPSTLTIAFKNDDGEFTLGDPTFDIAVDQGIRLTETLGGTTSARFAGYVQNWPTSWDSPTGTKSTTRVTAVDRLSRLERARLRSMLEEEILLDSPSAYYTLGEPEGATAGGDTSGNSQRPLGTLGSGTALSFGTGVGPIDGLTAVQLFGGKNLGVRLADTFASNILVAEAFVALGSDPVGYPILELTAGGVMLRLSVDVTGLYVERLVMGVGGGGVGAPGSWMDGQTRHLAMVHDLGTGDVGLYIDGVDQGSTFIATTSFTTPVLYVGRSAEDSGVMTGTVSHVAVWQSAGSPATRIAAHALTGLSGTESSDDRVARLVSYVGMTGADLDLEAGSSTLVAQSTSGGSVMDALNDAVATEGGALFIAGDGKLTLHSRNHPVAAATSAAVVTLTTADTVPDNLTWSVDKNHLVNYVEASRPNGATQTSQNAASVAQFDQYPESLSLLVETDDEVADAAAWRANANATVAPRLTSVTVDLMTLADDTLREDLLGLELGDRITISGFPSQSPEATADLLIEGWSEEQSIDSWTLTLNTIPAETYRAWILGDSTYSVLGSTTRLYY